MCQLVDYMIRAKESVLYVREMSSLRKFEPDEHRVAESASRVASADETPDDNASRPSRLKEICWVAVYVLVQVIEWTARSAIKLAAYWKEQKETRRSGRSDRLVGRAVASILSMPEFSHSVRVHGSGSSVLLHLKENEANIIQHYADLREGIRSRVKSVALFAAVPILYIWLIGKEVPKKWRENDGKSLSDFPSTQWAEEFVSPLGREGAIAASLVFAFLAATVVHASYVQLRSYYFEYVAVRVNTEEALLPHVRVALNAWSERKSPTSLRFEKAPALSSITDSRYVIDRAEVDRIATLIHELGASAVAISGPRGAGKSTLLHSIATSPSLRTSLCISIEAPASYEPKEFVITLYRQLCEYMIERASAMTDSRLRSTGRTVFTGLRVMVGLCALMVVLTQWQPTSSILEQHVRSWLIPQNLWQAGSYLALLNVLYVVFGKVRPNKRLAGAMEIVDRAVQDEERLRFLQNVAIERSGGFKAKVGLELSRKRTRQLLEQPASLPDLVRSYRAFAEDSLYWWRRLWNSGHLVVIIDELDRVTDVESAERFINDVKGVFGIRHCTYLVTVSEDALSQFERRMVGIRPVLDSTFDEVVRLPVLNFQQAKEMLARRLVGFPQAFIALCHSLSGGIPRDLIRTARALIDLRRSTGQNDLLFLTHEIVCQEVRRLKSGLIGRVNNELTGSDAFRLLKVLADPDWPARDADSMLRISAELVKQGEAGENDRVSMELGVALFYYGTILQVFTEFCQDSIKDSERLAECAQALAVTRSVMPASVELAFVHIQRLRDEEFLN